MRILMLGNSFTYYHDMPDMLASMLGAEVVAHTCGGAMLAEQLDPENEMGARTIAALKNEKWDYVVLQEQSNAPITQKSKFLESAAGLCALIKANGAKPVMYSTWAYKEGSDMLASMNMPYEAMDKGLEDSYMQAALENGALIAKVGAAFTAIRKNVGLYDEADDYHPSEAGSVLAASTIAMVIETDRLISP